MDKTQALTKQDNDRTEAHATDVQRKTIGERAYNGLQFWFVKGLILVATAAIGYYARYGKEGNWIRELQKFFVRWVREPMGNLGMRLGTAIKGTAPSSARTWIGNKTAEVVGVLGAAFASTMVLFHGGNVVAPIVQWFENHRKEIIARVNHRFGKPGDEERGNEKFKDLPKQSAGDVIKGRTMAWLTVFATFVGAFLLLGKSKVNGADMYRFDRYEEWFSRLTSRFSKKGNPFADLPLNPTFNELAKENTTMFAGHEKRLFGYRISNILAMDVYATTMGIIVWNFFSRLSARTRKEGGSMKSALGQWRREVFHHKLKHNHSATFESAPEADTAAQKEADAPARAFTDDSRNQPKSDYRTQREDEKRSDTAPAVAV